MWIEGRYNEDDSGTTARRPTLGNDNAGLEYRESWWHSARCRTHPHKEVFHAETGAATAVALACCRMCPVMAACRADALRWSPGEQHGVAGGMTADERRRYGKKFGKV